MLTVTVNGEKTNISATGERNFVLAEALCCVDACRDFLSRHMNISKQEAVAMIVESMLE